MPQNENHKYSIVLDENYESDYLVDHFKCSSNWTMPNLHKHNCHELYFLMSGDVRYVINHDIYDVNAGDVVVVPKNQMHSTLHRTKKNCERILIYFSDEFISALKSYMDSSVVENFFKLGCVKFSPSQQERVLQLFFRMEKEQIRSDPYSRLEILSILCELIVFIMRYGTQGGRTLSDTVESRILDAVQYIYQNYNQLLSLHSVAKIACVEATYFSKILKKITGTNFYEFLTQVRLKKAEDLLLTSPMSINQIAESCGFTNGKNFWAIFKKNMGISPREYRNRQHESNRQDI